MLPSPAGSVRARLVLGGTDTALRLVRLTTPVSAAEAVGLVPPRAWAREEEGGDAVWRPLDEVVVRPGEPFELELAWDPARDVRPVAVQGWAEAEGKGAGFAILVGPRTPAEIDEANRRSALLAEARGRGVPARTLGDDRSGPAR